jgi:cell wall-associated NlpC family hydrolase
MQTPITQTPAPLMTRLHDWPERLAAVVASAQHQPYRLGQHDCLTFSCSCVAAVTGVDLWPRFAGYTTTLQKLRTIAAMAPTLADAVDVTLGASSVLPLLARRGDVLIYTDADGEHLGVCLGASGAALQPQGLAHVPLEHAGFTHAWRIG